MKEALNFPWQVAVQTSEVQTGMLDEWDIPPERKVYACENARWSHAGSACCSTIVDRWDAA